MIEKKIKTIEVYQGDLLNLQKDSVELSNGAISTREWIKHPGAACCIPILPNSKIGLIKQFRYGTSMAVPHLVQRPTKCGVRRALAWRLATRINRVPHPMARWNVSGKTLQAMGDPLGSSGSRMGH